MVKVVVANRLVRDGKTYKSGDVIDVTPGEARDLDIRGKTRLFEQPAKADVEPSKPGVKEGK